MSVFFTVMQDSFSFYVRVRPLRPHKSAALREQTLLPVSLLRSYAPAQQSEISHVLTINPVPAVDGAEDLRG